MTPIRPVGGFAAILLSLAIWFQASRFPNLQDGHPGPALFPKVVAIGFFICGVYLIVEALRARREPSAEVPPREPIGPGAMRIGIVLLTVAVFPFAHLWVGFIPAVGVLSFLVAILLGARPPVGAATALGGTVVIYLLFTQILGVPL